MRTELLLIALHMSMLSTKGSSARATQCQLGATGLSKSSTCLSICFVLQTLNWNSHHIDDYIMEVMALVRDVNETLATIKGNVKRTSEVLAAWVANPMFDRKEGKVCGYFLLVNTVILGGISGVQMYPAAHAFPWCSFTPASLCVQISLQSC